MEEDGSHDGPHWNPDFVPVFGVVNNYNADADIVRTHNFLRRVHKGESLETLITKMTEQHIDPFALYFNQCIPFREAYGNQYVHGDIPLNAKLVVTPGLHYMLREASDDRDATTFLLGGIMTVAGFFIAGCGGEPLALLAGPLTAAGTYGLFKLGQHVTKSGKSRAFADYLERTYDLTSSVRTHTPNNSNHIYHDITRTISKRPYLVGDDVPFYPSWCYDAKQDERYFLTEGSLDKEHHVYGLTISIKDGFLPSLTIGSFHSYDDPCDVHSVELTKIKKGVPLLFKRPLFVPRQDAEKFQSSVQRYVTLLTAQ